MAGVLGPETVEAEMLFGRVYREVGAVEKSRVQGPIATRVDLTVVQRRFLVEQLSNQEHTDCH